MNNQIDLICTDIDGTLLDVERPDFAGLMKFKGLLAELRQQWGTKWAIVTGRHKRSILPILNSFLGFQLQPDFIVLEDAYIYHFQRRRGMRGFHGWNLRLRWKRALLWRRGRGVLQKWQKEMEKDFPEMRVLSHETVDLWMEFPSKKMAERGEMLLKHKTAEHLDFDVLRWGKELFLAPSIGKKGEAVERLSDYLQISGDRIFAVGDGANDINMLEGWAAGMAACVANAPKEIQQVVQHGGGYVANSRNISGVIEALHFYLEKTGKVLPSESQ